MKISIITVCLNSVNTIEDTIKSVIGQKDEKVEYIIIDGGSIDGTLDILNKYKDVIDIIVSESDQGIYDAMNKGILLSKGEVIGIINSDDWYEPGVLKKVWKCFCDLDVDIVYGKMNIINEHGEKKLLIPRDLNKMRFQMVIPHPTVFVRKTIYEKYGFFSLKYKIAADYELMLRFYVKDIKFIFMDEVLANFRLGGVSRQQLKLCTYEGLNISKKYLPYCPLDQKADVEKLININEMGFYFRQLLDDFSDSLLEYISRRCYVNGSKKKISIFGAGQWGSDMNYILSKADMSPTFIFDNNKELWGKVKADMTISPPYVLDSFDGVVLILVKEFSEQILLQIQKMNNPNVICITWEDLVNDLEDYVFLR